VTAPAAQQTSRRKRAVIASALVGVLVVGGGIAVVQVSTAAASSSEHETALPGSTADVQRGDLQGTTNSAGTLAFADPSDLKSGSNGVLTWLPEAGGQVAQGQPLYAVANQKVYLLHGALPAWRAFEKGMSDGPDVQQLEQALQQLGYFSGTPNAHFDWSTVRATLAWQKATGQEQTGSIPLGAVVFQPTDVRIAQQKAAVGDQVGVGTPIISLSSLVKQVDVQLTLAEQRLAVQGGKVQARLPDGKSVPGTIESVGVPTPQNASDPNSATIIPVTIVLDDPGAADGFQQASVVVTFPTETRKKVLSVPLTALIALPGGKYGVQVVGGDGRTHAVEVTTGLFAANRVEVSGNLKEGEKVRVPSS
jgi:peptidoglycan hydrolase-like protein with peptidoglycan-binding domain